MILRFSYCEICQLRPNYVCLSIIGSYFYYTMNSEQMINSIYNPKKKQRQPFVFPKITKADPSPPSNKVFVRGGCRKYNPQNIFKIEDDKRQKVKLHIEQERMRELRSRQCEQLQQRMAQMARKHTDEMREIDQAQKQLAAQIEAAKKQQYDHKLGRWELKNQIMNLNSIYLEEQNQYKRLYEEVGYIDEEGQGEGDEGEGEYCEGSNQQEEEQYQGQNLEGLCLEGEQANEEQPKESSHSLDLQMQQLQLSSQLQLQQESHSAI